MKNIITFMFVASLFYGCADIVESDLSDARVIVVSPVNNTVTSTYYQQFIWEDVPGALSYQLQIVKPEFSAVQQFLIDTVISSLHFSYNLQPGTYQWRVRAKNGSSASEYSVCNLTIDSTLDLSGQTPVLSSPADNYATTSLSNTFVWQTITNATSYIFQILSSGTVIYTQSTSGVTANYTFASDGLYQWRVFAQNVSSGSGYTERNIYIDNSAPSAPVLLLPLANDTASNPVQLEWSRELMATADSVIIYTDTNLTILSNAILTTSLTYSYTGIAGQDYFWRVRSRDAAGNWGPFSVRRKFIINP